MTKFGDDGHERRRRLENFFIFTIYQHYTLALEPEIHDGLSLRHGD